MKRLTLVKVCNNHNIAHLYEHMFCNELERLFVKHGLINSLDYDYYAESYYGGFIHLQILLFTVEAEKIISQLRGVNPSFDEPSIGLALMEIRAEKQAKSQGETRKIAELLKALHDTPWQDIEQLSSLNTATTRRTSKGLTFYDAPSSDFRVLTCTASLVSKPDLPADIAWPLFQVVTESLLNNLTTMLAREHAYYGYDKTCKYSKSRAVRTVKYRISKQRAEPLTIVAIECENLIQRLFGDGYVSKVVQYLGNATYNQSFAAPDELQFYEASELLVGAAGWREIATEENIVTVLKGMGLSLSMAKEQRSVKVI